MRPFENLAIATNYIVTQNCEDLPLTELFLKKSTQNETYNRLGSLWADVLCLTAHLVKNLRTHVASLLDQLPNNQTQDLIKVSNSASIYPP